MIFLHPLILRERDQADGYTRRKYQDTRHAEIEASNGPAPALGGRPPLLYRWEELPAAGPEKSGR